MSKRGKKCPLSLCIPRSHTYTCTRPFWVRCTVALLISYGVDFTSLGIFIFQRPICLIPTNQIKHTVICIDRIRCPTKVVFSTLSISKFWIRSDRMVPCRIRTHLRPSSRPVQMVFLLQQRRCHRDSLGYFNRSLPSHLSRHDRHQLFLRGLDTFCAFQRWLPHTHFSR